MKTSPFRTNAAPEEKPPAKPSFVDGVRRIVEAERAVRMEWNLRTMLHASVTAMVQSLKSAPPPIAQAAASVDVPMTYADYMAIAAKMKAVEMARAQSTWLQRAVASAWLRLRP